MRFNKSDLVDFLACDKTFWLARKAPARMPAQEPSKTNKRIIAEGFALEALADELLQARPGFRRQVEFETARGLFARTDWVREYEGGIDLYEVKLSTRVGTHHIIDATFQKVVAEEAGHTVNAVKLVHVNSAYRKQGSIDAASLLAITDITQEVADLEAGLRDNIDDALALLAQEQIDEKGCDCRFKTRSKHCRAFAHFNPRVHSPSIYDVPNMSEARIAPLVTRGIFGMDGVTPADLTPTQQPFLRAAQAGEPIINHARLSEFLAELQYPLYFLDYEAIGPAIPLIDGVGPFDQVPFQYSLHVREAPGEADRHREFLVEEAVLPDDMLHALAGHIGPTGNVIVWNKGYEKSRNNWMAEKLPHHADFLTSLNTRIVDLMDPFKADYVDAAFGGSTSIKAILPVLVPTLSYKDLKVANGEDAMSAWVDLIAMPEGADRAEHRANMLAYCERDTEAMVRIYDVLTAVSEG